MKNISVLVLVASVAFMAGVGVTYISTRVSWTSDMADQPSIKPQELPLLPPRNAVPTEMLGESPALRFRASETSEGDAEGHDHGAAEAPGHHEHSSASTVPERREAPPSEKGHTHPHGDAQEPHHHGDSGTSKSGGAAVPQAGHHAHGHTTEGDPHSHGSPPARPQPGEEKPSPAGDGHMHEHADGPQSKAPVVNPIKPTAVSVSKGEQFFNIYCQVCHGPEGQGGMPMDEKIPAIPEFTAAMLRGVSDDHMFSMVTAGHGPMPGYAEALTPEERWHVSNYVRSLQTRLANGKKQPDAEEKSR